MPVKAIALLCLVVVVAGCNGGTVDRHALTNDAATIDSLSCEGWLLSRAVARGRVTSSFAREHAGALRLQASNFADALGKRPTSSGLERRVRAKAAAAATLAARLRRLHDRPTDRAQAARLARQLQQAGSCS